MSRDDDRDHETPERDDPDRSERNRDRSYRDRDRDYDDRERSHGKKSSSTGTVLLIVGGIGCLVVLVCGGLIGLGIWAFTNMATKLTPAIVKAEEFMGDLQQNQIDRAYSLTSKEYQKQNSSAQFADYIKKFEMFTKHTSRSITSTFLNQNQAATQVTIQMTLNSPNNAMTCTLILIEEQDTWKISSLSVP